MPTSRKPSHKAKDCEPYHVLKCPKNGCSDNPQKQANDVEDCGGPQQSVQVKHILTAAHTEKLIVTGGLVRTERECRQRHCRGMGLHILQSTTGSDSFLLAFLFGKVLHPCSHQKLLRRTGESPAEKLALLRPASNIIQLIPTLAWLIAGGLHFSLAYLEPGISEIGEGEFLKH